MQSKNIILNVYLRDKQCDESHEEDPAPLKEHTHRINVDKFIETTKKVKSGGTTKSEENKKKDEKMVDGKQSEDKKIKDDDKQKDVQDVSKETAALTDHHFSFFFDIPTHPASSDDSSSAKTSGEDTNAKDVDKGSVFSNVGSVVGSKSASVNKTSNETSSHGFHVLNTAHQNGDEAVSIIMPDVAYSGVSFQCTSVA